MRILLYVILMALWAFSCAAFFWLGRTRREDEVISNYRNRLRRQKRDSDDRLREITSTEVRVRESKMRPRSRGYFGEELDEES